VSARICIITLALALSSTAAISSDNVLVPQGGVARWPGLDAVDCGFHGKRFAAVDGVCYYAIDFKAKTGVHEIALYDQAGQQHLGSVTVERVEFPEIKITLPDDTYMELSAENAKRHGAERARVLKAINVRPSAPLFSLPLAKPAKSMPASENDFGSRRLFNETKKSTHTGRDSPVSAGSAVMAVADGKVVLAEDQFFTGNAAYIDHGDGLVSMYFHMAALAVATGDEVKQGAKLGTVGATGRATGPHLHLGVRWMGARIDPYLLLEDPSKLPAIGDPPRKAAAKIEEAHDAEPLEQGPES
jgi:murein DD-endopeptidase MepM/ murein hydrolase activator NlpD